MSTLILTNIGELTTNVEALGDDPTDPTGVIRGAAVAIVDGRIAWVGRAADRPRSLADVSAVVVDAEGRAVIPGFVDSHTHLVFAGDRADEFAARMAGQPYVAGGIRRTVAATRAASDDELRARLRGFVDEMRRQGTTTFEVKTGYDLTVDGEARLARLAREVTDEVTFLGAHVVPDEFAGDRDAYIDLVCGPMLDAVRPYVRWIDVFCERGAFTPAESRRILLAGIDAGLLPRLHANQLGHGRGARLAAELDEIGRAHV